MFTGDDELIARLDILLQSSGKIFEVQGGAASKDNLIWRSCIEEFGDFCRTLDQDTSSGFDRDGVICAELDVCV